MNVFPLQIAVASNAPSNVIEAVFTAYPAAAALGVAVCDDGTSEPILPVHFELHKGCRSNLLQVVLSHLEERSVTLRRCKQQAAAMVTQYAPRPRPECCGNTANQCKRPVRSKQGFDGIIPTADEKTRDNKGKGESGMGKQSTSSNSRF